MVSPSPRMDFYREVRATFRLAMPIALAQMGAMAMALVDVACVGRFSELDLGAVGLGNAVIFVVMVLGTGIPLALDPLVAQAFGAGDHGAVRAWWRKGVRLTVLFSLPIALLSVLATWLLPAVGIDAALSDRAGGYVVLRAAAAIFYLAFIAHRSLLQAVGQVRILVPAVVGANVLNLAVDLLFIYGDPGLESVGLPGIGLPPLGALGAGLATLVSSVWLMVVVGRAAGRAAGEPTAPLPAVAGRKILEIGLPIGLSGMVSVSAFSFAGVLAARFGAAVVGAHQVALMFTSITFMAAIGIGGAASARVGQAIGRGDGPAVRLAGLAGIAVASVFMACAAGVFLSVPHELARLFTDQPDVLEVVVPLIGIAAVFQIADGIQAVTMGALRGAGDVRAPLWASLVAYWLVGVPVAWYLATAATPPWGVEGLWYGLTVGLFLVAFFNTARFWWLSGRPIARVAPDEGGVA